MIDNMIYRLFLNTRNYIQNNILLNVIQNTRHKQIKIYWV